jgi:hypothetical protein
MAIVLKWVIVIYLISIGFWVDEKLFIKPAILNG